MSLKKGEEGHAAFYSALRVDLLSFIKCCIGSGGHHILPDLLLLLLLLLLSENSLLRRSLERELRGRIAGCELRAA